MGSLSSAWSGYPKHERLEYVRHLRILVSRASGRMAYDVSHVWNLDGPLHHYSDSDDHHGHCGDSHHRNHRVDQYSFLYHSQRVFWYRQWRHLPCWRTGWWGGRDEVHSHCHTVDYTMDYHDWAVVEEVEDPLEDDDCYCYRKCRPVISSSTLPHLCTPWWSRAEVCCYWYDFHKQSGWHRSCLLRSDHGHHNDYHFATLRNHFHRDYSNGRRSWSLCCANCLPNLLSCHLFYRDHSSCCNYCSHCRSNCCSHCFCRNMGYPRDILRSLFQSQ